MQVETAYGGRLFAVNVHAPFTLKDLAEFVMAAKKENGEYFTLRLEGDWLQIGRD
jgi:hypothetical protein